MSLSEFSINNRVIVFFTVALFSIAGVFSFFTLGQLEDPEFTVKSALIITHYPGASPEEVEQEVTDKIENALQEMPELKSLHSRSTAGTSLITVEIKGEYWSDRLPQVWDKLRRKVGDVQSTLPEGVSASDIIDDFGDVYGLMVGVVGDGFTYREMEDYVKIMQKEISLVEGIARIDLWGNQDSVIYIDILENKLASMGLSAASVTQLLRNQNLVVDAGHVESDAYRLNVRPTGSFTSPQDIGDLLIHGQSSSQQSEFIRISDIGTITEGYVEPARTLMRINGQPAIVLSISPLSGTNVVEVGERVSEKLEQLKNRFPVGIEVEKIHWQSQVVDDSVQAFLINFAEAVLIVLVVLTLAMGWKMGVVIGSALVLTILSTFVFLAIFGIDLHRMSLGALIIALGMMVDNAIVVAEGYVVKLQQGRTKAQAAIESAKGPSIALLGATVIAVMAFYPIFASTEDAGEYCRTLFIVIAISLLVSWVVSLTLTPLQCILMLSAKGSEDGSESTEQQEGKLLTSFRSVLEFAMKKRLLTVASLVVLLAVALGSFGNIAQIFFPNSSMTKFTIDYWAPEGSRIESTSEGMEIIEQHLLKDSRIKTTASFIGQGSPRFYLPVSPENPSAAYGQIIVNVHDFETLDAVVVELRNWLSETLPNPMVRVRKYGVGPSVTWTFEARFLGPADADPAILRNLAEQGMNILYQSPIAKDVSTDWRQQVLEVVPEYSQIKARRTGISRSDLANTTKRFYDGYRVGTYRRGDTQLPIVVRENIERRSINDLDVLQIEPGNQSTPVPLGQVINGVGVEWVNPIIWRYNRHRAITVQASPIAGTTAATLRTSVIKQFEAIPLPEGYRLQWFGEHKSTVEAQASLVPGVVPAFALILFILVALFNAIRPMIMIVLIIPFVMIGVSFGLQVSGAAFGFVAILGVMSLAGMMIKNSIVLVDQIEFEKAQGKDPHQAIIDATISRIRPVFLAAATTVLGVIPLVADLFWQGLAVSIMAGLSFGTILTMILLPVLYSFFYKTKPYSS